MSTPGDDPVVKRLRDQITENDLELVGLLNKRLSLVDELWRYKAANGIDMYVPEREQWMVTFLTRANEGPLSDDALCTIYRTIVETSKAEATRLGEG
jgi:chorismate mutase/prephenate dehydrogenase